MGKVRTEGHDLVCPVVFEGMVNGGLTKRELFASAVMQGLLANEQAKPFAPMGCSVASMAVRHADALIEALNTPTPAKL